jgi:hypothetical protein
LNDEIAGGKPGNAARGAVQLSTLIGTVTIEPRNPVKLVGMLTVVGTTRSSRRSKSGRKFRRSAPIATLDASLAPKNAPKSHLGALKWKSSVATPIGNKSAELLHCTFCRGKRGFHP